MQMACFLMIGQMHCLVFMEKELKFSKTVVHWRNCVNAERINTVRPIKATSARLEEYGS